MGKLEELIKLNDIQKNNYKTSKCNNKTLINTLKKRNGKLYCIDKTGLEKEINSLYNIEILLSIHECCFITNISLLKKLPNLDKCILTGEEWRSIYLFMEPLRSLNIIRISNLTDYLTKRVLLSKVDIIMNTKKFVVIKENNTDLYILSEYILKIIDTAVIMMTGSFENIYIDNLDVSDITDFSYFFHQLYRTKKIILKNFDTRNARNFIGMFRGCKELEVLDIACFKTNKVANMTKMFAECNKLKNLDLSHFNIDSVIYFSHMFLNCNSLRNLNISTWKIDTNKGIDFRYMFAGCNADIINKNFIQQVVNQKYSNKDNFIEKNV